MAPQPGEPVNLVIVDDDLANLEFLSEALEQDGVAIQTASDPEVGLELILTRHPDIVLLDLMMPGLNGMDVLDRIVEFDPAIEVIMMTGHYSCETAVCAIKRGASDYVTKPVDLRALRTRVESAVAQARWRQRAMGLESEVLENSRFEGMTGNSPQMWELFSIIRRVAPHYRSALIIGETGTGKELVARALHQLSPHASGNFVPVNCSSVVETLFESELFGHVKGAFTGATHDKLGLIEYANNGTLFLDEIGDMPLAMQAKLLRVLQESEVQRLGSLTPRKVNLRVLAATHRDLRLAILEKRFREDLFYRLSMIEIEVPRLGERESDIALLTRQLIGRFAAQFAKPIGGITRRAQILLDRHSWPGNVRELENVIGHACIMVSSDMIDIPELPQYLSRPGGAEAAAPAVVQLGEMPSLGLQEKQLLIEALTKAGGNQAKAARLLRISRDVMRYRMKRHGVSV